MGISFLKTHNKTSRLYPGIQIAHRHLLNYIYEAVYFFIAKPTISS